jgi:signal transduction histidine kinase
MIKHVEAKSVEVQFTKTEKYINLIVEDIGKGFDADKIVYGLGSNSIKNLFSESANFISIQPKAGV